MTDQEAEEMLRKLSEHFRKPVMPIDRYCRAFETWREAQHARAKRLREELYPGLYHKGPPQENWDHATQEDFARSMLEKEQPGTITDQDRLRRVQTLRGYEVDLNHIESTALRIRKSNLLARLLYGGEKLRPTMCPEHKGVWSGIEWRMDESSNVCPHGCNLTGWIPEAAPCP